jgi:hypothetical protein
MSITNITIDIALSTPGYQITLPLTNFIGTINWGDSNIDTFTSTTNNPLHTYTYNGIYTISLLDVTNLTHYGNLFEASVKPVITQFSYLIKINSLINLESAFYGHTNLANVIFNTDVTDNVINMQRMFYECTINCPIELNCISCINLSELFAFASAFNSQLTLTNTNNATDMSYMFYFTTSFNQPINLDCSSCTTLRLFLGNASVFNSELTLTNTNNVTDMAFMFYQSNFNQPINLNCSSCTTLNSFLFQAYNFNNSLNLTPIPLLVDVENMLDYTSILPPNYSDLLILWGNQSSVQPSVIFNSPDLYYNSSAITSLNNLRNEPNNWTITNNGPAPAPIIYTMTPTSGPSGTNINVIITGINFDYTGLFVKVNELFPPFQYSSEQIQINMPNTILPSISTITIQTNYGIVTQEFTYTENFAPTITSITPLIGTNGTIVTLIGTNFNYISGVFIESEEGDIEINSNVITNEELFGTIPQLFIGTFTIKVINMYNITATTEFTYENENITNEQELLTFLNSEDSYGIIDDNIELTENIINILTNIFKYLLVNNNNYKLYKV